MRCWLSLEGARGRDGFSSRGKGHLLKLPALPSPESVSRTDSPSKIIKLDTVRLIAERVSTAPLWAASWVGRLRPGCRRHGLARSHPTPHLPRSPLLEAL